MTLADIEEILVQLLEKGGGGAELDASTASFASDEVLLARY
jgi:hypothetical protein